MARKIDLISREDAEALFRDARKELFNLRDKFKSAEEYDIRDNMLLNAEQMIHALPSKTGHWISHYDEDAKVGWYECDRCRTERAFNTKFCPDCGCRMVEPQERSDKE